MKTNLLTIIGSALLMSSHLGAYGYDLEKDGIYYDYNDAKTELTVTYRTEMAKPSYTGDIIIPSEVDGLPVTSIGMAAFYFNTDVTSVTIPESVSLIGMYAISNTSVTKLEIPETVQTIEDWAFGMNAKLETLQLPSGMTAIPVGMAAYCSNLVDCEIPAGVTRIEGNAFYKCAFSSLQLPAGLEYIGTNSFAECNNLEKVALPKTLSVIEVQAFTSCLSLEEISVDEANANYASIDGMLLSKDFAKVIIIPTAKDTVTIPVGVESMEFACGFNCLMKEISLPASLRTIGMSALCSCRNLTVVDLPESVTELGAYAFSESGIIECVMPSTITTVGDGLLASCGALKSCTVPGQIKEIPAYFLAGAYSLEECVIEEGVTTLKDSALGYLLSLKQLTLPSTITDLEDNCLSSNSFTDLYVNMQEPVAISSDVFKDTFIGDCTLHVPAGTVEAYQKAPVWKKFGKIVEDGDTGTTGVDDEHGKDIRYYTSSGIQLKEPIKGINIVVEPNGRTYKVAM